MRQILTITLTLLSLGFSATLTWAQQNTSAPSLKDTLIISDIDDTIRLIGVSAYNGAKKAKYFLTMNTAFAGTAQLLNAFQNQGAKVVYVSGVAKNFAPISQKFLNSNGFPKGALHYNKDSKVHTYVYKVEEIQKILLEEDTTSKVIFIGDNGQKDISVYETIQQDPRFSNRVVGIFIHTLYADAVSRPLPTTQVPWITAGDLALRLYDLGFIDLATLLSSIESTITALNSSKEWGRSLAIPDFACIRPEFVEGLRARALNEPEGTLRLHLMELTEQVASSGRRFFGANRSARENCAPQEFKVAN